MTAYKDMLRLSAKLLQAGEGRICFWCPGCQKTPFPKPTRPTAAHRRRLWAPHQRSRIPR